MAGRLIVISCYLGFLLFPSLSFAESGQSTLESLLAADPDFAEEMNRDFQEFNSEIKTELVAFRDERDADFAEFLKEQWEAFTEFDGLIRDPKPKPVVIPKALEMPKDTPPPPGKGAKPIIIAPPPTIPEPVKVEPPTTDPIKLPAKPDPLQPVIVKPVADPTVKDKPIIIPQPEPKPVAKDQPLPVVPQNGQPGEITFYGKEMVFYFDPEMAGNPPPLNNEGFSAFWSRVSKADYPPLLDQLILVRQHLALNDWGFYQLLNKVCQVISADQNERVMLSWFLLNKSGFQAKMAYDDGHVFLLVPSGNTVYGTPFYNIEGERYYNFTFFETGVKPGQIKTYRRQYPGADSKVKLGLTESPQLPVSEKKRLLEFSYQNVEYTFPVKMNLNAIEFYRTYPGTDMTIFFNAMVDPASAASLIDGLRPIIANKPEADAANMILRFVQTAFDYKTDGEQFGGEKYLFTAETLFYPFSDCEDRSIIFSYLIRKLLNLKVVGLIYPGHAATAVRFSQPMTGDQLEIDGERYLICDPTYINADIGTAMPQFKETKPRPITIN